MARQPGGVGVGEDEETGGGHGDLEFDVVGAVVEDGDGFGAAGGSELGGVEGTGEGDGSMEVGGGVG